MYVMKLTYMLVCHEGQCSIWFMMLLAFVLYFEPGKLFVAAYNVYNPHLSCWKHVIFFVMKRSSDPAENWVGGTRISCPSLFVFCFRILVLNISFCILCLFVGAVWYGSYLWWFFIFNKYIIYLVTFNYWLVSIHLAHIVYNK